MLPTFQVRGLRCCSSDSISVAEDSWADIQLDNESQYEQLICEHPETILSYVDDDDGEIITVGSGDELVARVDELQPLSPVVFDLLVSPSHPDYETALKLWRQIILPDSDAPVKEKGKGKAKEDVEGITSDSGKSADFSNDGTVSPKEEASEVKEESSQEPLLSMFENELQKIFQATAGVPPPSTEAEASPVRSPSPIYNTPQQYPSVILGQTLRTIAQNVGRVAIEIRNDIPSHTQPTVEALNTALHSAIGSFTSQLQAVALEASAAARTAAQATREMNVSELEATGRRMKELAETVGHIAVQGAGVAREEVDRAFGHVSGLGSVSGQAEEVPGESEVSAGLAKGKEVEKEAAAEQADFGGEAQNNQANEDSGSTSTHNTVDAVNIPACGVDTTVRQSNSSPDSSSDDELDLPGALPRGGHRRRRPFDPLRPQGGHVDGPARIGSYPHWAPGHHMFHPRHPRHGRPGPHHGGPHHGPPSPHSGPHHGPPPPHGGPHHGHHSGLPRGGRPEYPGMPGSGLNQHPMYSPPHVRQYLATVHSTPESSPPRGIMHSPSRSSYSLPSPPSPGLCGSNLFDIINPDMVAESSSASAESQTEKIGVEQANRDQQENGESTKNSPHIFPFMHRSHTMSHTIHTRPMGPESRDQWSSPHYSVGIPSIPSAQHVMRRFPSLSSFSPSPSAQSGGLRPQASVPNFSTERRFSTEIRSSKAPLEEKKSLVDIGENPFATPPRQSSPTVQPTDLDIRNVKESQSSSLLGQWPSAVLIPPPPPPAPIDAFSPRGLPRVRSMGVFIPKEARSSLLGSDQGAIGTNPFAERRRRRNNRLEDNITENKGDDWEYYSGPTCQGSIPPKQKQEEHPQGNSGPINDNDVDACVARLLEMGYAEDESESALERLRVYSQIAEGSVHDAVELLEEEKQAWGQRN